MIDGRVTIVTGASRGIGRGIARLFASSGVSVVLVARGEAALEAVATEIADAGGTCEVVVGDVSRPADCERMVHVAVDRFGRLDVLCHNAGIYPETPIEDMGQDEWDLVCRTNLTSTFLSVKASLPVMRAQKRGRIVLVSSITGPRVGYPGLAHYAASKSGMNGFMRAAAVEFAPHGITINAVEPGSIRTEGLAGLGEEAIATMEAYIPMGMLGEPEDIGHAAMFLASDGARFITGQSIVVDGGQILPEDPAVSDFPGGLHVVTGGGGAIGSAIAARLRERGAEQVLVCDIDGARAKKVANRIGGEFAELDLGDPAPIDAFVDHLRARETPVAGIVHCAAIFGTSSFPRHHVGGVAADAVGQPGERLPARRRLPGPHAAGVLDRAHHVGRGVSCAQHGRRRHRGLRCVQRWATDDDQGAGVRHGAAGDPRQRSGAGLHRDADQRGGARER